MHHSVHGSPYDRLRRAIETLTTSKLFDENSGAHMGVGRVGEIRQFTQRFAERALADPDNALNALAKLVRPWGINLYLSRTRKVEAAPKDLYSVITGYPDGQTTAEHYTDPQQRRDALTTRVAMFANEDQILLDQYSDQRLAALLSWILAPAVVSVADTRLNPDTSVYETTNRYMSID